jgi:2-keto-4-pentenoate hydratase/2-oxohepta-3-ene-1,7-dioic acid hydratase in catechol pathway
MRLVTFNEGRVGRVVDDRVVELDCASTRQFFERGGDVAETGTTFSLADVTLRAPIVPKKFFHTAGNFREHADDLARINWSHAVNKGIVFFQNVDAIVGPGEPVIYPEHLTNELDYEIELAIIIGKPGKFFTAEQAVEHIAGYTVFNDVTARDIQRREMESGVFSFCKAIDTFCPIGPWIVTADEIGDPQKLDVSLRVNGETKQHASTAVMIFSVARCIAELSKGTTLEPGDVIATGTPEGVGFARTPPEFLKHGDVMEAEIEKIGVLRSHVSIS